MSKSTLFYYIVVRRMGLCVVISTVDSKQENSGQFRRNLFAVPRVYFWPFSHYSQVDWRLHSVFFLNSYHPVAGIVSSLSCHIKKQIKQEMSYSNTSRAVLVNFFLKLLKTYFCQIAEVKQTF